MQERGREEQEQAPYEGGKKKGKINLQKEQEKCGIWEGLEMDCRVFLATRNFGVASAASDDMQNREEQIEGDQWKKDVAVNGWFEREDKETIQELVRK